MILEAPPPLKWECGIRTVINKCSQSFRHIQTDMTNVLCICGFMYRNFCSRIAWFPWLWTRTMKWHCRQWSFSFSFPSQSFCLDFQSILHIIFFWQELTFLTPQIHWWRADSWRLQTALSVCLLITASPCGQCGRVGLLEVFKSELFEANKKANDVCFYKVTRLKINVQERLIDIKATHQLRLSGLQSVTFCCDVVGLFQSSQ